MVSGWSFIGHVRLSEYWPNGCMPRDVGLLCWMGEHFRFCVSFPIFIIYISIITSSFVISAPLIRALLDCVAHYKFMYVCMCVCLYVCKLCHSYITYVQP